MTLAPALRDTMNGKPVFTVPSKTIINFKSGFAHKLLCDGLTFTTGSACVYKCAFCYVPDLMKKSPHLAAIGDRQLEDVVIRRADPVAAIRAQLVDRHGRPKFNDPNDRRVIYASPLVDVAGNMELVRETVEVLHEILTLTNWHVRLLSKSNLLPKIARHFEQLGNYHEARQRIIYGVSTGTLDDTLAAAFEEGTAKVSKRIESLHWLQDNGFRTFGMICPSLPQRDYHRFAQDMKAAIRADRCENVWAEVLNVRGESMKRTIAALWGAGYEAEAVALSKVSVDWHPDYEKEAKAEWEHYARATFEAHVAAGYKPGQLLFLQYVGAGTREYWTAQQSNGAVLL